MTAIALRPASEFSIVALTDCYNTTRADYLVPMPMTAERFATYVRAYDVSLDDSRVALQEGRPVALALLGVRRNESWITRLGVDPEFRGQGIARQLADALITASDARGIAHIRLEVITENAPAQRLFRSLGFRPWRELLIQSGVPADAAQHETAKTRRMSRHEIMAHVGARRDRPSWKLAAATFPDLDDPQGLKFWQAGVGQGWLVYQVDEDRITHVTFETMGDHRSVLRELLVRLAAMFPGREIEIENISTYDMRLHALSDLGFAIRFRRIEMALSRTAPGGA